MRAPALAAASLFVSGWAMPPHAQLDHIVVAMRSLDEGIAQFERLTGVKPAAGGKHPGRGTENALLSLGGGTYLEIRAPQAGAALSKEDERLRGLQTLTIVDWAIGVPDVDAARAALGNLGLAPSAPRPGARLTPAGERLDWMTFDVSSEAISGAPFFIRWSPNTRHPSTTAPSGCGLTHFSIQGSGAERLSAILRALDVSGIHVGDGPALIEAGLTCGSKQAVVRSAPR
jgi:hypothetical protein